MFRINAKASDMAQKAATIAVAGMLLTACGLEQGRLPSESSNEIILETISDDYALPTEGFPDQVAKSREIMARQDPGPAHRFIIAGGTLEQRVNLVDSLRGPGIAIYAQQAGDSAKPLILQVERTVAIPPSCGNWEEPSTHDYSNLPPSNHGCAHQSNLARMVADPEDLRVGRPDGPYETERGTTLIDGHRRGTLLKPNDVWPRTWVERAEE